MTGNNGGVTGGVVNEVEVGEEDGIPVESGVGAIGGSAMQYLQGSIGAKKPFAFFLGGIGPNYTLLSLPQGIGTRTSYDSKP